MPTIKYPKNPNIDTAFVEQEDGTKNRALMIAPQDISTLELPNNPNSTKGYITVDGKKQRVILTADITGGGGGGSSLPDQTGNAGKFLTTDGTDASWADALTNKSTQADTLSVGVSSGSSRYSVIVSSGTSTSSFPDSVVALGDGINANPSANNSVVIGRVASVNADHSVAIGRSSQVNNKYSVAIGASAKTGANGAIQLGKGDNNTAGTLAVGSTTDGTNWNQYELLSANGTIPADRLVNAINKYSTMPTAASTNEGWIVQFTGTTDATYTHGYIYECVSDGGNPATYSWSAINVQPGSSGGLQNTATGTDDLTILGTPTNAFKAVNIGKSSVASGSASSAYGYNAKATNGSAVAIGDGSEASGSSSVAILGTASGYGSVGIRGSATATYAVQIGGSYINNEVGTFKFANGNGNWTVISNDGTIPAARHASLPAADGTYTLQLVIADGVPTLSWVAE